MVVTGELRGYDVSTNPTGVFLHKIHLLGIYGLLEKLNI